MGTPKDDGGLAFPALSRVQMYSDDKGQYVEHFVPEGGMELRDYFAAQIVADMIPAWGSEEDRADAFDRAALRSYQLADAMLKARAK